MFLSGRVLVYNVQGTGISAQKLQQERKKKEEKEEEWDEKKEEGEEEEEQELSFKLITFLNS